MSEEKIITLTFYLLMKRRKYLQEPVKKTSVDTFVDLLAFVDYPTNMLHDLNLQCFPKTYTCPRNPYWKY